MRKIIFAVAVLLPLCSMAQFGIKAGVNFASVTNASDISASNESGFMVGVFLAPPSTGIMGFRTELIYSKQGYNYKTGTNTGTVNLDYILLPQLMQINITKFVSIQAGFQMAFLINAKADSTPTIPGGSGNPYAATYSSMMDYYNKFDYGVAAGVEVHPFKGLLVGARYNLSLGNLYKDPSSYETSGGQPPSFIPSVDAKNNVVQLFVGWIFGNNSSKKQKQTQPQQ